LSAQPTSRTPVGNRLAPSPRIYAVGDIHGCERKLRMLFKVCVEHSGDHPFQFIFLGDYIDRGDDSRAVIEWLMSMQAMIPEQILCLRGNHEDLCAGAMFGTKDQEAQWLLNGGDRTLLSYGVHRARDIPQAHRRWMLALPLLFREQRRLYVHAGIVPGVPLQQQPRDALLWIRDEFLSSTADHGFLVVHGHTPLRSGRPELRRNRLNIDTGACFGGPLTAAVFCGAMAEPLAFLTDSGDVTQLREESEVQ
jgi:serine/threonine protein phosphatase 1